MNGLTVVLALLAAFANASASVLMRRAATEAPGRREPAGQGMGRREPAGRVRDGRVRDGRVRDGQGRGSHGTGSRETGRPRRSARATRRPFWVGGAALLVVSAVLQAAALAVGSLSLVQPLLASELLFTLVIGSVVFHRRPDRITWLSFLALAFGLALFLVAAAPSSGRTTADGARWVLVGAALLCAVLALVGVAARLVTGAPLAAVLGLASAVLFAATAALIKEVTGRIPRGLADLMTDWPPYATAIIGLAAFVLLQCAFRAGTLVASQPALTLGDALTSMALGWALFGERIALGARVLPEVVGIALVAAGTVGLASAPAVSGQWDTETASGKDRDRGRAEAESA
ncbi:DMT family transporter [Streptomyces sp. NPDC005202]|uniref:DMT family transporter n=1 Tax=Streptomyces sp. NPDC005202 TaxID=3157021 RepID=UPI0033A06E68